MTPAHPRPSLPFTVVADGESVHLVAGEDVRYTVRAGPAAARLAELLRRCDGTTPLAELPHADDTAIRELLHRLAGERILVEGPAEAAAVPARYRAVVEGTGPLAERFAADLLVGEPLAVLCQETLDWHAAQAFNRRCLRSASPWLWVTTGPADRGYVSPVFLPDAGPCLACLLGHFRRLSPVPHLHDALTRHGEEGGTFTPVPFSAGGLAVLEAVARWKVGQLARTPPPAAVFRLHVLELESMEVGAHRVFRDPLCPECADARLV